MKTCPFCREQIQEEAVKCRYCASSLLPPQPEPENKTSTTQDQVVYIIDRDLIRFAKFALALLAIFITVGAVLYGFNVKEASDRVQSAAEKVRDVGNQVEKVKKEVAKDQSDLEAQVAEVEAVEGDLRTKQKQLEQSVDQAHQQLLASVKQAAKESHEIHLFYVSVKQTVTGSALSNPVGSSGVTATARAFTVTEIAHLYDFPAGFNGRGQTIGLIELGGGYKESDLAIYFADLKLAKPNVKWVAVDGASNQPTGEPDTADGQVLADIEITGTVANSANIVVYFAPNTSSGFVDAVTTAVHDPHNKVSVISIAWGSPESSWTAQAMTALDQAFKTAAASNITVCAAAGDNGATDGVQDGQKHVDFPASSPWVVAVGGTSISASANKIQSEVVWDSNGGATGGGISGFFPVPPWQSKIAVTKKNGHTGRNIPDVAAQADPVGGYELVVDGKHVVQGGTSAAAPLWAGLIALLNQAVGRNLGYINPWLYADLGPAGVFNNITEGTNSVGKVAGCHSGPGWNDCTGWGSPDGQKLLAKILQLGPPHS